MICNLESALIGTSKGIPVAKFKMKEKQSGSTHELTITIKSLGALSFCFGILRNLGWAKGELKKEDLVLLNQDQSLLNFSQDYDVKFGLNDHTSKNEIKDITPVATDEAILASLRNLNF